MRKLAVGLILGMLAGPLPAGAHMVWLERDGAGAAQAFFGEWDEGVKEKTGGALDRIAAPLAFGAARGEVLAIERKADHLAIAVQGPGDVRLVEESMAPRDDRQAGGKTKTIFHAKAGRTDTRPGLDLELVPLTAGGEQFVLLLRGAPMPKAALTLIGPPLWQKPLRTDAEGKVSLSTPWAGQYLVEVAHVEAKAGEGYDRIRHVSTLTFVVDKGMAWPAR